MGEQPQGHGPVVDLVDDTFVACAPATVARAVADPARWAVWWPDLRLTTTRDRGAKGRQWAVQGALTGTAEIWLEPWWDGVLLHFYLRAEPSSRFVSGPADHRAAARLRQSRAQLWKRQVHRLKDELEHGRGTGEPSWSPPGASVAEGESSD